MIGATAITSSATVKSPVIGEPTSDAFTSGPAPGARGSVCRESEGGGVVTGLIAHRIAQRYLKRTLRGPGRQSPRQNCFGVSAATTSSRHQPRLQ